MSVSLQVKSGIYYAVFRITDEYGKPKMKWVSTKIPAVRGRKREAQKTAQEIAEQYKKENTIAYPKTQFWKWVEDWIEQKRHEIDKVTVEGYQSYYKCHIEPYFKKHSVSLDKLSPMDIQKYFNEKAKCLSGKSLHNHKVVIHGALQDAVRKNIIPYNPADRITMPKKEKYHANYYTQEQLTLLLKAVKGTPLENIVPITIFYGLRRSEAVGLKWKAVNFESGTVTIETTVVRFSEVIEKNKTKNQSSRRTYPMTEEIREILLKIKENQNRMKELLGDSYIDSGYVFTWDDGRMLSPDYVTRKFLKILTANNLPTIRFHDLRHSCATLLLSMGYDLPRISKWLGHSDIGTTVNLYGHLGIDSKKDTAAALSSVLSLDDSTEKC